ncbi:MAG: hypothetical protein BWK80_31465 [Desulfobacteraceae bacterium IS3]|jgi:prevent-host-death family protein|nr:MAG: hypothetical protein BWK80_31465 [Desulfobacteraceae bacterium IS3]HAO21972.1 hypothetical protein [Desulfobacteraceae bacterium]
MLEISVKEIRHHLGSFLDRVEDGEEIMIIRRGKKIARLTPAAKTELFEYAGSIRIDGNTLTEADHDKKKRAFDAVGRFSSDRSDVSINHDDYLSDIYGKIGE